MSTLYGTLTLFGPADIFNIAVIMEQFFIEMNGIYIHQVNAVFLCTILGCFLLHLIHGSGSHASTHHSEVANFAALCASLPICQALPRGMAAPTVSACLFCGHFCLCGSSSAVLVHFLH